MGHSGLIQLCSTPLRWRLINPLLISGTDTGIGKTVLAMALFAYWQKYYPEQTPGLFKLLACGDSDLATYAHVFGQHQDMTCPLHFTAGLAPALAAAQEGKTIDIGQIWNALNTFQGQHQRVFVEAVGGLGCPLTWDYTVADLAKDWRLPVLLVAPLRLGVLSQVVVHSRFAQKMGIKIVGIVLNQVDPEADPELLAPQGWLAALSGLPCLGILPYVNEFTPATLAAAAAQLDLEYLLN